MSRKTDTELRLDVLRMAASYCAMIKADERTSVVDIARQWFSWVTQESDGKSARDMVKD